MKVPSEISRQLLGNVVDEVFDGAIEDVSVIEDIYRVIVREYGHPARYGQPVEPESWQLVPKEPTEEMMYMGVSEWATHDDSEEDVYGVWEAMLAAAPKFGEGNDGSF